MTARVLHVLDSLAAGGIETTFTNVLRAWRLERRQQIDHDVLAFSGGPLEDAVRDVVSHLFIGGGAASVHAVLEGEYDVVHVLFERCGHRLAPAVLCRGRSRLVYGKGYDMAAMYRIHDGFSWPAEEALLAACDAVTFTTARLAAEYPDLSPRSHVLGKAVDWKRFSSLPGVSPSTPARILIVANLHRRKRLSDMVSALPFIASRVPDVVLRIVGDGPWEERRRLVELASGLGVDARLELVGHSSDVATHMAESRVVALPSECEGVPTALLEGMSAGRPVLATRVGHLDDVVEDGRVGYLVAVGDIEALADRATELLTDSELAGRLGRMGRECAEQHDVGMVAARLMQVLLRVIDATPRGD